MIHVRLIEFCEIDDWAVLEMVDCGTFVEHLKVCYDLPPASRNTVLTTLYHVPCTLLDGGNCNEMIVISESSEMTTQYDINKF